MRLRDAATFFDRVVCTDAYGTVPESFKGQLNLFDDSMRDGTTVVRRVLSVADDVVIPPRRAVKIHDEVFLVGGLHKDSFNGDALRVKYVVHRADGLAEVLTADKAVRSLAGPTLYAARLWVKDMKEVESSSKLTSFMNLYVAPNEAIPVGSFVRLSGRLHVARNALIGASGLGIVEVDELAADALAAVTYTPTTGGVYDPTNDRAPTAAPVSAQMLQHRWQDDFAYRRMSSDRFEEGDLVGHVSKTKIAIARAGDSFVLNAATYRVLSARDDGAGAWTLHARPR